MRRGEIRWYTFAAPEVERALLIACGGMDKAESQGGVP